MAICSISELSNCNVDCLDKLEAASISDNETFAV